MRLILPLLLALAACSPPSPQKTEAPAATATAPAPDIIVVTPQTGAHVTSPLVATGTAPGNWYFEASFPAELIGPDGRVIAEAPAQAQSDWMTPGPVNFRAELSFNVTQTTQATLLLQEDNTAGHPNTREVRVPVVLEPR